MTKLRYIQHETVMETRVRNRHSGFYKRETILTPKVLQQFCEENGEWVDVPTITITQRFRQSE